MKKHFVITNFPVKLPVQSTILYSFLLYYFKVDNIWWGIFITLYSIFWIIIIVMKCTEKRIDLTDTLGKDISVSLEGKKFQQVLEKLAKEKKSI